jgi:F0F1-type ATP synthase membrane subunit c/vacuolar-type H+-ATPase subunit K
VAIIAGIVGALAGIAGAIMGGLALRSVSRQKRRD